jgi:hypothetical protein
MREGRYEHDAQGKPEAFSPSLIVTRENDTARFWRSVFGKVADLHVRQWPNLLSEGQFRLPPLKRSFVILRDFRCPPLSNHDEGWNVGFD